MQFYSCFVCPVTIVIIQFVAGDSCNVTYNINIMENNIWLLKAACLMMGAALHLAPISTMREIKKAQSTLSFHIAPYAFAFLNHAINGWYAYIREDPVLIFHRFFGLTAQTYYIYTYLSNATSTKVSESMKVLRTVGLIISFVFAFLHILSPLLGLESAYRSQIAFFGALAGIGLAASPLATVREVLRNKDASSLPPLLCSMVFVQCSSWAIYGYVTGDWSTLMNNTVGSILGLTQLVLIYLYGQGKLPTTLKDINTSVASEQAKGIGARESKHSEREDPHADPYLVEEVVVSQAPSHKEMHLTHMLATGESVVRRAHVV